MKHTLKDEEVDDETTDSTQKLLNGHTSMWLKMSKMGESHQHQQRQRATHIEQSATVPPLYLLVKDHKKQNDDEPPSTCPVCGATAGMNNHLSNIISVYLEATADEMDNNREVISTEDALSRIDRYNKRVEWR